jgi:hypothetical protein
MWVKEVQKAIVGASGVIQRVDRLGRKLTVLIGRAPKVFNVARGCLVVINEQMIEPSMLRPMDYAQMLYRRGPNGAMVHFIRVTNWWPSARQRQEPSPAFEKPLRRAS